MSGGVDSSVAAALLLEQGYPCVGATLDLFETGTCGGSEAAASAARVAQQLGIEHHVVNGRQAFEDHVLRPAWAAYSQGRTPNPCVRCNERVKFAVLLDFARSIGAEMIATGHYVRLVPTLGGRVELRRGVHRAKDQSYFLFRLSDAQRAASLTPLGELEKDQVRAIAGRLNLASAERRESQDACFATEDATFAELLSRHFDEPTEPGRIVDPSGQPLGLHEGIHRYTIGQRQGLNISLGKRAWVSRLDPVNNEVELTTNPDDLLATGLLAADVHWLTRPGTFDCGVQIRYRAQAVGARVEALPGHRAEITFDTAQRAVTPGQAVVFYDGDLVLGGGWIEAPIRGDSARDASFD